MKRGILVLLTIVALVITIIPLGCTSDGGVGEPFELIWTGPTVSHSTYLQAVAVASVVNKYYPDIVHISTVTTPGGTAAALIPEGKAHLCTLTSMQMYQQWYGLGQFEGKVWRDFHALELSSLACEYIVALKESGLTKFEDMV